MRNFRPKQEPGQNSIWYTPLPTDCLWGIYARQSSPAQVLKNTQSTEMQTDDLVAWLLDRHIAKENISLFDADLGVSGTLRIDQRSDLQRLVEQIQADMIKAVLVYQVSRLFRDETGVQYNTFAAICKQHHCLLATPDGMIFNFNNPMHLKMFRYLAEMAAEYIPQQIGLLHAARLRKAKKGLYAGLGSVPIGYIVDYDKKSPTYEKYVPYEPHAEVVRWLFQRYFELEGNILALRRELNALHVLFPSYGPEVDQRTVATCRLRRKPEGYHLSRPGLLFLLTNPVYVGWWIVQGDVISRENHEPIVEESYFWYAFNRLSDYTVQGEVNEQCERQSTPRRFYQRHTTEPAGLLKEKITSPQGDVYTHMLNGVCSYIISPPTSTNMLRYGLKSIDASLIDSEFVKQFFKHLRETSDFEMYKRWLTEEKQKRTRLLETLSQQLGQIDIQQEALLDEIVDIRKKLKAEEMTEKEAAPLLSRLRARFDGLETTKKELGDKCRQLKENQEIRAAEQYADFQTEVEKLIPVWDKKPLAIRQEFVNLFIQQAVITVVSTHWIELAIEWKHPAWNNDKLYIFRSRGSRPPWTAEQRALLKTCYDTTDREELLIMFPDKSWNSILQEANALGLSRRGIALTPRLIHKNLTYSDWQFMQAMGIAPNDRTTRRTGAS